ncbi:LAME_0G14774g1_1 [Lachancea meyersii CBS 8951]|uniref:4a-hydroxytetrahydrobiopterin dehydratase n=1 Tax=Lachancea meyersii CBS 8951 TaxID=1266667 RepID=A0A1G4KAH9_9SACH|nr:LAME_0G14774g1_1 [Lachancea meyersii CBS 8951]
MYNKVKRIAAVRLSSAEILKLLEPYPRWNYDGSKLTRNLSLRDFETTWSFLTQVAMRSHLWGHHPTITTCYNKVNVQLTTHDVGGVSDIDMKLVSKIESYAAGREQDELVSKWPKKRGNYSE